MKSPVVFRESVALPLLPPVLSFTSSPYFSLETPAKIQRCLAPHSFNVSPFSPPPLQVSVIGDSPLALVLSQRLLACNYRVLVSSERVHKAFFTPQGALLHDRAPDFIATLSDLCKASDVLLIAVSTFLLLGDA